MEDTVTTFDCDVFAYADWDLDDIYDERLEVETMFTSELGIAISITSSVVSTCGSLLVIYLILRSAKGLKGSVYHRILFAMSTFDIVQSVAISFVTLPMPVDMIYRQFQGLVLGNNTTCRIQGFLVALGSMTGINYNLMLSIYYLCSIRYDMLDDVFSKIIEPWLHAASIFVGTFVCVVLLVADSFHPTPTQSNWCAANAYPYYCPSSMTKYKYQARLRLFSTFAVAIYFIISLIILLSSMALIVSKVRKQKRNASTDVDQRFQEERSNNGSIRTSINNGGTSVQQRMQERLLFNMRTVSRQAWAYTIINLFNYFMIVGAPMVRNLLGNPTPPVWWQMSVLILRPLQGLFNCIIFIHHKVNSLQRNDPTLRLFPALRKVLKGQEGPDRILSDLILVRQHSALSRLHFAGDHVEEEEEEDDDEENSSEYSSGNSQGRIAPSSSPFKEANGLEEKVGEERLPLRSTDKVEQANGTGNGIGNSSGEGHRLILRTPEPSATGDGEEVSQDLSGFISPLPTAFSESLSFSLESKNSV